MAVSERPPEPSATERLRRIESLTDAELTYLDVEDLLVELLDRVREVLEVDTATVLLVDHDTGDLVATAARGGQEEVREGLRVPFGGGFAGRVAAEVGPMVVDLDDSTPHSHVLRDKGVRTLLGVPLVSESRVIGVLHVGSLAPRRFRPEEIDLLQLVADRAALAVDLRRSRIERTVARVLQRSLIPDRLPTIPGLDMAGRYLPAEAGGVGGDWYDVFVLPAGRVGLVIGDVIGHGLAAAVVMGRLRSALRAYALDAAAPEKVLERLDRKLQHFETGQMTTVLYAVLDPSFTTMRIASAGHPLPMVSTDASATVNVDAAVDPPLGITAGRVRHGTTLELAPGSVLSFFTDGLVERRGESIHEGLARLAGALKVGSAHETCSAAIAAMVGTEALEDDAALLVLRREDEHGGAPLEIEVAAVPSAIRRVRAMLRRWLADLGVGTQAECDILLAVGEATTNAVAHAYGPAGGSMRVEASATAGDVVVTVSDHGRWRSPRGEHRGRGLAIMRRCANEVSTERADGGTRVRLAFHLVGSGA